MKNKFALVASLSLVVTSVIVPGAPALATSSIVYSPNSGTNLDVGDTLGSDLNTSPQTAGTYDMSFIQTWSDTTAYP